MEVALLLFYVVVGAGVGLQFWGRGTNLTWSATVGITWPLAFGLAIGEVAYNAIKWNYARLGMSMPDQRP